MTNSYSKLSNYDCDYIEPTMVDTFLMETGYWGGRPIEEVYTSLQYKYSRCWYDAMVNKEYYDTFKNKKLKLVFGGLYIDDYVIFGDERGEESCERWIEKYDEGRKKGYDAHCWLEDKNGKVYDFFHREFLTANTIKKKPKKVKQNELFEGKSKKDLLEYRGIRYYSMPDKAQHYWCYKTLELIFEKTFGFTPSKYRINQEVTRLLSY